MPCYTANERRFGDNQRKRWSKNRYILIQNGDEQVFEGFGYNVPLEIIRAHGIPKIYIDRDATSAVNLAEQLEAPFLISESGSNRAKALGRLVGIHIIDAAQRTTLKDLIDTEQRCKSLENDITSLKEELKSYKDIERLAEKISYLKVILEELKQKRKYLLKLLQIRQDLGPTDYEIKDTVTILSKISFIDKVERYILMLDVLHAKYGSLYELRNRLSNITHFIKVEEQVVNMTHSLVPAEQSYFTALELNIKLGKLVEIHDNIKNNDTNMEHTKKILDSTKEVSMADKISFEVIKLSEVMKRYSAFYHRWESINQQLDIQKKELNKYVYIEEIQDYSNSLSEKILELSSLNDMHKAISAVELSITKGESYLQKVIANLNFMAKEYSLILKKFSICPTCLKPMDEKTTQKIIIDILK